MIKFMMLAGAALTAAGSSAAEAQSVKSTVTASNGVAVTVYADEFANRYEYTAPSITAGDGFVLVATVKKAGVAPPPHLTGAFIYSGEWRRYNSAIFRGGSPAKFIEESRNVGRCSSSRYSRPSCTLTESFKIELTPTDIAKHAENGKVAIQVRAQDTSTTIIEVPVAYIDAVNEVAKR